MNVLILTPDAVGSTLLQRLITIYMQFHTFDKPVINLHELTNGLLKYHSDKFNQEVLGKYKEKTAWGYHQSLEEIVSLLDSVDHYKTSRLAQYHIKNRQDSLEQQIPFYRYLNDNFFIVACRRHNVFEHAISWAITKVTKKLNVYTPDEKISSFFHLYKDGLTIDPGTLIQTLESYKNYLSWCENHFSVASYFYYDEHLPNIERYILNLPIFAGQPKRLSWKDNYDMEFHDWNKCHYLSSDIGTLALDYPDEFQKLSTNAIECRHPQSDDNESLFVKNYQDIADPSWPKITSFKEFDQLPSEIKQECIDIHKVMPVLTNPDITVSRNVNLVLPSQHLDFLNAHSQNYNRAKTSISTMVNDGIMVTPPPIKKQTMLEKKFLINNFNQCLDVFNKWILENPEVGNPIDVSIVDQFAQLEQGYWKPETCNAPVPSSVLGTN